MKLILNSTILTGAFLLFGSLISAEAVDQSQPIKQMNTSEKLIALTFDDGPDDHTLELLKLFKVYDAKATFFVIGHKAEKQPEIVRMAAADGHEIGNHGYTHKKLPELSAEEIESEIATSQQIIESITGIRPTSFRAPYLKFNEAVWAAINKHDLTAYNASVSTRDWERSTTKEQVIERATSNLKPGTIVLMHSTSASTLSAMPEILEKLKLEGYRCVTLSELKTASENRKETAGKQGKFL